MPPCSVPFVGAPQILDSVRNQIRLPNVKQNVFGEVRRQLFEFNGFAGFDRAALFGHGGGQSLRAPLAIDHPHAPLAELRFGGPIELKILPQRCQHLWQAADR
jgi:hypothetical protein